MLAACAAPAPQAEPPPDPLDPDGWGPYEVGVTTAWVDDPRRDTLTVEIWYPGIAAPGLIAGGYEGLAIPGRALRQAEPDLRGAPYPPVAFSHGHGGVRFQSAALCERLASHGFVVVAVDHPGDTLLDFERDAFARVAAARPGDVAIAMDGAFALADGGPLDGLTVDGDYAIVGHSFGAWTSLVVGGGQLDIDAAVAHCASGARTRGCGFFDQLDGVDPSDAVPDPRATVTVGLSAAGWYSFGPAGEGLASVRAPLMLAGTRDGTLPYDSEMRPTWEAMAPGAALLTLDGAGHWGFSDLCTLTTLEDCGGTEDGYMDPDRTMDAATTATTAWLRVHLAGDDSASPWLDAAAWPDEDLTWEIR